MTSPLPSYYARAQLLMFLCSLHQRLKYKLSADPKFELSVHDLLCGALRCTKFYMLVL